MALMVTALGAVTSSMLEAHVGECVSVDGVFLDRTPKGYVRLYANLSRAQMIYLSKTGKLDVGSLLRKPVRITGRVVVFEHKPDPRVQQNVGTVYTLAVESIAEITA